MSSRNDQRNAILADYLKSLKESPRFGRQVVCHRDFPAKKAAWGRLRKKLPEELTGALESLGLKKLYSHQAEAINSLRCGRNVITSTPTASGKTLIYTLPVFESILADYSTRALFLFPLKALAQDQLRSIDELASLLPIQKRPKAAICDGDTPAYQRGWLRRNPPHILISNPDMLHLSLLPYHDRWSGIWTGLKYVILDEAHTYRGIFGSHMAWVMRRLNRICRMYGSSPQFIMSSATIGNPGELATSLINQEVDTVSDSGAPQGAKHFVFLNPEDSAAHAASQLLEAGIKRSLRTIVYTQSRKLTELVSLWTQSKLGEFKDRLTSYRAGYLPEERREIEQKLASGKLLGVVSTSALELGIDIGGLDLCILVGYPGTVMQTWQRSGRVGRQLYDSLTILIAQEDAMDQHFMRTPEDFFDRAVEKAVLNPGNRIIQKAHLVCAAAEQPLEVDDPIVTEEASHAVIEDLYMAGMLMLDSAGQRWFTNRKYPQREISLRGSGRSLSIVEAKSETMLGEIDGIRCRKETHAGAIYLHRGQTWEVLDLDLDRHRVTVHRKKAHFFTRTFGSKETEILQTYGTLQQGNIKASFGYLRVTDTVNGFQRRLVGNQKVISSEQLNLPPLIFETEGLWIEIPPALQQNVENKMLHFMGGIHAMEHAMIAILPLLVLCDRNDIGGIAYPFHPHLQGPAIFIYDGYPGGVGLTRQAFTKATDLLRKTLAAVAACPCEIGCPTCVHSPKCGSGNRPIDKQAAIMLLRGILESPQQQTNSGRMHLPPVQQMRTGRPGTYDKSVGSAPAPVVSLHRNRKENRQPCSFCVFDIETKRSAAEVGGWHQADRMGISVAVLYDSKTDSYYTFFENQVDNLVDALLKAELVIGFNNKLFDNRVLSAYTQADLLKLPTLDLLESIKNRLGYRLSLDHLARNTLGVEKSGDGLQALRWFKEGRMKELSAYCRQDVEITKDLYLYGREKGYLLFNNKAGTTVRCPVYF